MITKLSERQYDSLYEFVHTYLDITNNLSDNIDKDTTIRIGLKMMIRYNVIDNLQQVTDNILKTDRVLIPVATLEKIIKE